MAYGFNEDKSKYDLWALESIDAGGRFNVDTNGGNFCVNGNPLVKLNKYNITVPTTAHGQNQILNVPCFMQGYRALGVVDYEWASGTRQNFFNIWRMSTGGANLYVSVCNVHASDSASGTLSVTVLYVSQAAYSD